MNEDITEIYEKFHSSGIEKIAYASDASGIQGKAIKVLMPKNAREIKAIIESANKERQNIVPRGAGTGLCGGCTPQDSIVLDLSSMNKIEIDEKNKLAIVEPGAVLDSINAKAGNSLAFPVIPSSHAVCTIGGMIATDAAGNRAVRFGKTSTWIEEIIVIDGAGKARIIREQELMDFCGNEGTTGIVVRATLKLAPVPKTISMDTYNFGSITDLMAKAAELKKNKSLISLEFIDKHTAQMMKLDLCYHLLAEYDNESDGKIKDTAKIKKIWKLREGIYPALASKGYSSIEDPKIGFEKIADLILWLEKKRIPCFGHIGIGIIHPCFWHDAKVSKDAMYRQVIALGGKISGEHGIGLAKKAYIDKEHASRIKALKQKYDPNNVLNRGKLI